MNACPRTLYADSDTVKGRAKDGSLATDKIATNGLQKTLKPGQDPEYHTAHGAVSQGSLSQWEPVAIPEGPRSCTVDGCKVYGRSCIWYG